MSKIGELLELAESSNDFYLLMNKDRPVYKFKFTSDNSIQVLDIFEKPPFWIKDLQDWLAGRSAAKHRKDVKDLLEKNGALTLKGFTLFTQCLSLTDTLWVKKESAEVTWDSVNLYDNAFEESIGVTSSALDFGTTTPTFSTDGSFAKCWKWGSDRSCLVKRGRTDLEPYAEAFASMIKLAYAEVTDYYVSKGKYYTETSCYNISTKEISLLPYSAVSDDLTLSGTSGYYTRIGSEKEFNDMLLHDALTLNIDRHSRNFGVLIDSDTYDILRMAPLYDFNMCYGFDRMYTLKMPIEDLAEQNSRRFGKFLDALEGRVNKVSLDIAEDSLKRIQQSGIPCCSEELCERMISITRMQLKSIRNYCSIGEWFCGQHT